MASVQLIVYYNLACDAFVIALTACAGSQWGVGAHERLLVQIYSLPMTLSPGLVRRFLFFHSVCYNDEICRKLTEGEGHEKINRWAPGGPCWPPHWPNHPLCIEHVHFVTSDTHHVQRHTDSRLCMAALIWTQTLRCDSILLGSVKSTNQGQMIIIADAAGTAICGYCTVSFNANSQMKLIKRLKFIFSGCWGSAAPPFFCNSNILFCPMHLQEI